MLACTAVGIRNKALPIDSEKRLPVHSQKATAAQPHNGSGNLQAKSGCWFQQETTTFNDWATI